jgi:GT2 family glycosyltransferase
VDRPAAPSVRVVVVAHDPGEWFEDSLASIAAQDYPRLSVSVVVSGVAGADDAFGARVHRVVADAEVVPLLADRGFSPAANAAIGGASGAFLLICHDDVALAPDAVRLLVEEAIRSNAAVVGPKLVDWDDPRRILQVGIGADKTGAESPHAERGELDQEQHDAVRDVFAVPSACVLVRRDLFEALGGFDEVMSFHGEDLDLCWRAHVAGARVMLVPDAVVGHREALATRRDTSDGQRLRRRHEVRMLLSNYGLVHSLLVIPQAVLFALAEMVVACGSLRFGRAREIASAWVWNFGHFAAIIGRRRSLATLRLLPDGEVRHLQVRGFARLSAFFRERSLEDLDRGGVVERGRELARQARSGPMRVSILTWAVVLIVFFFGSRHLITRGIPVVGDLAPFGDGLGDLYSGWFDSLRTTGLGSDGWAPPGFAVLSLAGTFALGQLGLLRTVLVLGVIPVGGLGVSQLLRPFSSRAVALVGVITYLVVPLPYNALANGSWTALILYGAAPWVLARLASAEALPPFGLAARGTTRGHVVVLGLVVGAVGALAPELLLLVGFMIVAMALGSLLAGTTPHAGRLLAAGIGGVAIALVLELPWVLDLVGGERSWTPLLGARSTAAGELGAGELMRFAIGPLDPGVAGWALLGAASLSVVLARDWRLVWALRGWILYVGAVALAWVGQQGWFTQSIPRPEVLLVPGAVGIALAVGMGMASFQLDLHQYGFGWRQLVPAAAAAALVVAAVPVLGASFDGRWDMPRGDFTTSLAGVDDDAADDSFRTLWIGDADVLGLGAWPLDDNTAFAVAPGAQPDVTARWPGQLDDATAAVADVLDTTVARGTDRLGRLLAPMGIRYVVVVERLAPAPFGDIERPVDPLLVERLAEQLDLERLDTRDGLVVFRNSEPAALALAVGGGQLDDTTDPFDANAIRVDPDALVFGSGADGRVSAPVGPGRDVFVSSAAGDWHVSVDGVGVDGASAYGWAEVFDTSADGGVVDIERSTPTSHRLILVAQILLWLVVAAYGLRELARPVREAM